MGGMWGPSWWILLPSGKVSLTLHFDPLPSFSSVKNAGEICHYANHYQNDALGPKVGRSAFEGLQLLDVDNNGDISLREVLQYAKPRLNSRWFADYIDNQPCR